MLDWNQHRGEVVDATRFDGLARTVGGRLSRRGLGRVAAAVAVLPALDGALDARAKKRRVRGEHNIRGKKAIMCLNGQTIKVPKKKRKKYLRQGATRGKCPTGCTPTCAPGACGMADGCGGTCGCARGAMCMEGTCQPCTVTCEGTPAQCGKDLTQALARGGAVYVCPGHYSGPFTMDVAAQVYGAGSGTDAATSTILDGMKSDATVAVGGKAIVALTGLRITNGDSSGKRDGGGGIYGAGGSEITVADCVIDSNTAKHGGGVYFRGKLEMTSTQVTNNTATAGVGGGIHGENSSNQENTLRNCLISRNTAADSGGGLMIDVELMTIEGTEVSSNTGGKVGGIFVESNVSTPAVTIDGASKVIGNTATGTVTAGGIARAGFSGVTLNGTVVSGNTDPQCSGLALAGACYA
jgi:hypothetical protein